MMRPNKDGSIMLVLSRKLGEGIVIGRDVEVTVLEVRGNRVKLGLRGPSGVVIHREELHARIKSGSADLHSADPRNARGGEYHKAATAGREKEPRATIAARTATNGRQNNRDQRSRLYEVGQVTFRVLRPTHSTCRRGQNVRACSRQYGSHHWATSAKREGSTPCGINMTRVRSTSGKCVR